MNSRRLIVAAVSLSLGLAGMHGGALAQINDGPIITGNVDGILRHDTVRQQDRRQRRRLDDYLRRFLNPGAGTTVISPSAAASSRLQ